MRREKASATFADENNNNEPPTYPLPVTMTIRSPSGHEMEERLHKDFEMYPTGTGHPPPGMKIPL